MKVIEIWECQWSEQVQNSPHIQDFIKTQCRETEGLLTPKECFKGGRTECFRALN